MRRPTTIGWKHTLLVIFLWPFRFADSMIIQSMNPAAVHGKVASIARSAMKAHITFTQETKLTDVGQKETAFLLAEDNWGLDICFGAPSLRTERKNLLDIAPGQHRRELRTSASGTAGVAAWYQKSVTLTQYDISRRGSHDEKILHETARYDHNICPVAGSNTLIHFLHYYGVSGARTSRGPDFSGNERYLFRVFGVGDALGDVPVFIIGDLNIDCKGSPTLASRIAGGETMQLKWFDVMSQFGDNAPTFYLTTAQKES